MTMPRAVRSFSARRLPPRYCGRRERLLPLQIFAKLFAANLPSSGRCRGRDADVHHGAMSGERYRLRLIGWRSAENEVIVPVNRDFNYLKIYMLA